MQHRDHATPSPGSGFAAQDINETGATGWRVKTRRNKIVRLCRQAYEQKAVLSLADVSLLIHVHMITISDDIVNHERQTGQTIPRRGTDHDIGASITHKAVICYKRLVEQKPTSQVTQETFHSQGTAQIRVKLSFKGQPLWFRSPDHRIPLKP
jgi:hypothetical protein